MLLFQFHGNILSAFVSCVCAKQILYCMHIAHSTIILFCEICVLFSCFVECIYDLSLTDKTSHVYTLGGFIHNTQEFINVFMFIWHSFVLITGYFIVRMFILVLRIFTYTFNIWALYNF